MDRGSDSPKINGAAAIYGVRWPAAAYTAAVLCLVFAFADLRSDLAGLRSPVTILFVTLALGAVWFGTRAVTSDATAVSKRLLCHSSSVRVGRHPRNSTTQERWVLSNCAAMGRNL